MRKENAAGRAGWNHATGPTAALVAVVVLLVALGAVLFATVGHGPRASSRRGRVCVLPAGTPHARSSLRPGEASSRPVLRGDFVGVVAAGGQLEALEVCGAREASLRVISYSPASGRVTATRRLGRSAPLTGAFVSDGSLLYVGQGRLSLRHDTASYRLSVTELAAPGLQPVRRITLGEGYGVELAAAGRFAVASGGMTLALLGAGGPLFSARDGFVIQHVAAVASPREAVLGLFRPSAVPPESEGALAVLALSSGRLLGLQRLPRSEEVESVAPVVDGVVAAVSGAGGTYLELFRLAPRLALSWRRWTSGAITLIRLPRALLATGANGLSCVRVRRGSLTLVGRLGVDVQAAAAAGTSLYAVVPGGIVRLLLPRACG